MKHPFLKSILILGSVLAFVNCGEDNSTTNADPIAIEDQNVAPSDPAWQIDAAGQTYLIYPAGIVTDATGAIVGTFVTAEGSETVGNIIGIDGVTPILENVDTSVLPVTSLEALTANIPASSDASLALSSAGGEVILSSANNTTTSSSSVANNITSSANTQQPNSSATTVASSSSQQQQQQLPDLGNVTVTGSLTQTVAQKGSTSEIKFSGLTIEPTRLSWNAYFLETQYENGTFTIKSATVPEYFEAGSVSEFFKVEGKDIEFKLTVTKAGGGNNNNEQKSSSSTAKSSSSKAKSSSSTAKSSSSKAKSSSSSVKSSSSTQVITTGCPAIKTKGGSGSGWATRYWDGCMPSCSWSANAGSNTAKTCSANGKTESNGSGGSVCDGGSNAACLSQIPFTVDGCTEMGFAFAAVPASNGGQCGKCFQLTFTGTGKYETKENHKALAGKKLIIMVSNIGSDVNQGQFDIMIPGGGYGMYNGLGGYNWGSQGNQYGGLLSDCESEIGYSSSTGLLQKRKDCLIKKCGSAFGSDTQAKEGCLFLANFMEAAGNPNHNYVEVECPEVLKSRY